MAANRSNSYNSREQPCTSKVENEKATPQLFSFRFKIRRQHIHYKYVQEYSAAGFDSRASELQTYLRKIEFDGHSTPFKVTCFGASGKAIRD